MLVENQAPWFPPSNAPSNAKIVSLAQRPLKETLVYQVTGAEQYLEGDSALTLRLLVDAVRGQKRDTAVIEGRRARWKQEHEKHQQRLDAAEKAAAAAGSITVPVVAQFLRKVAPNAIYVDETIVHARLIREHFFAEGPSIFFVHRTGWGKRLDMHSA